MVSSSVYDAAGRLLGAAGSKVGGEDSSTKASMFSAATQYGAKALGAAAENKRQAQASQDPETGSQEPQTEDPEDHEDHESLFEEHPHTVELGIGITAMHALSTPSMASSSAHTYHAVMQPRQFG